MSRGSAPVPVIVPVLVPELAIVPATEPVAAIEPTIVPEPVAAIEPTIVPVPVPELEPVPTQDNGLPGNDEPVDVIPGQTSD